MCVPGALWRDIGRRLRDNSLQSCRGARKYDPAMPDQPIAELLILVDNIERLLRTDTAGRERNQIGAIVEHMERISPDGSVVALANHVAIALAHHDLEGPIGSIAVIRALTALERLRARLVAMGQVNPPSRRAAGATA